MPARSSVIDVAILSRTWSWISWTELSKLTSILFESELGEVVIDEQREAEAEQQDQIRQEKAVAA